jgi:hypothetical protein
VAAVVVVDSLAQDLEVILEEEAALEVVLVSLHLVRMELLVQEEEEVVYHFRLDSVIITPSRSVYNDSIF